MPSRFSHRFGKQNNYERKNDALTLIELIVSLVLGTLVLGMVIPLLHELMHPAMQMDPQKIPVWQRVLQEDLRQMVSSSKCGLPVFQLQEASDGQPFSQLVLQTFCRAGGMDLQALDRGPSEVRYCLEADATEGPFVLVRYAKGWHDSSTARHVLENHVVSWSMTFDGEISVPEKSLKNNTDGSSPQGMKAVKTRSGTLQVEMVTTSETTPVLLWVPLFDSVEQTHSDESVQPETSPE